MSSKTPMAAFIRPHPGQETILKGLRRFTVVACGRRFGKTEAGKLALTTLALRGGTGWWLAPTYPMASQVWRDLKATWASAARTQVHEGERRIDFRGGGSMAIHSAHQPDLLRGAGLDFVVLDEAAFMTPDVWPAVIRPMLATRDGGALLLSTPRGRNWFWDLFRMGMDPDLADWASFHFRTADNPLIPPEEIAAIQASTPRRVYQEEYLAQFLSDAGQVFRGIEEAATAPLDAAPQPGQQVVAGVDWGREHDYTAVALIDAASGVMLALDRFNQVGWAHQRGRLHALCDRWGVSRIWAEENSIGAVNIEALQAEGLPVQPFQTTARSKSALIEALALAIERRELALLPDPVLLGELAAYALDRLPGGGYRYSAPPGGHDDTVIATALAWQAATQGGFRLDFA